MKKIYTLLVALMMTGLGFGQTLSAGDIAIIGLSVDNEEALLVALEDIPSGESVFFTDDEWGGTSFNSGEGFYEWVTPAITAGTVFTIDTSGTSAGGTVTQRAGSFALSNSGDGFFLYQTSTNIYNTGTYTVLGFAGEDAGDSGSLTGTGLTIGTNAVYYGGDNGIYTGTRVGQDMATYLSLIYDVSNWATSGTAQTFDLTDFTLAGGAPETQVEFIGSSASVSEGIGTFELEFTIINEDATNATTFDVVLISGDNADIDGYTVVSPSVTFPAGSAADQVLSLTITDDALFEADETLTFEIQAVAGGNNAAAGANSTFDLTITNNDAPPTIALPYSEDFSDCGTAQWVAFDETGDDSWSCSAGQYSLNGFNGTDDIDWLISNFSIDFDLTSNETIAVTTSEQFGDAINDVGEFELRYSTDYVGYGDPSGATWTTLAFDPNNTSTGFGVSPDSVTSVDASGISGTAYLAFFYDMTAGSGAEEWNITEVLIQEGALPTEVNFVGSSISVGEDSGTYDLEFAIANEDAINATTFDVVLTAGDAADIDSYATQTVTFPAGTSANQTLTITITDDILEETDEVLTFEIQNVAGGNSAAVGTNTTFDLTILANDEPVLLGTLYDADFTNDGDGFPAHTTASPPATGPASVGPFGTAPNGWFLSYDTAPATDGSDNIFEVIAGELVSDDWGGQGIFTSQVIDVTGISVVDITATGLNVGANDDNFTYFYILDGGARVETVIGTTTNGDPVNYSITSLDVSGATSLEVGFEFSENGGGSGYDISEFLVIEGSADTSVQFTSISDSVLENAGTYDLTFEITFEDAINDTTFDVVLTSGDAADINSYTTQTVTFPAGTSANQTVTVTITDDALVEPIETLTFEIQNVAGGNNATAGLNNTFNLDIQDNDGGIPLPGDIVISEIMYNSSGDDDEWIEIYNASGDEITLNADWRLIYDDSTSDFAGTIMPADSYLTIALGSNGDGTFNNDNPFTPDVSAIAIPAASTNDSNNLVNSTATIALIFEPAGANVTIDTVTYNDGSPWPTNADGNGPSLELIDVTFDNALAESWVVSGAYNGGTPGLGYVAPVTYTFNGTWSPSNPNGVAAAGDDIVIASGDATIDANTTCSTMTVNPGAGLTINSSVTLTANNGLTLESTSTSYSSLILDGTVAGTMTYERHVNINGTGTTGSNDLISAPLTGEAFNTFASANPNILSNAGGTLFLFGPFDKTIGDYVTYADTETATLDAGVGYRAASDNNDTFTFTGAAENGTVVIDIANSGPEFAQWNLIGNPYPSYINVQDFLLHDVGGVANLELFATGSEAIYGYDGDATNGWTIYNLATTTLSTVMAPGQGFFVSADATNAGLYDLEFTPAMRSTGTSDDFIAGRNAELVYLKVNLSSNINTYDTDFYFNPNASEGFDLGYDASVWGGTAPEFSIYSHLVQDNSGQPIALQALNASNLSDLTIPLGVHANQGEQLTFSIADTTLPTSVNVYLEDTVANTSSLLNTGDYVMTPTTNLSGTGRFFLRTSEDALSTIDNTLDSLSIFAINSIKELVVSGQLQENTLLNLYDLQGRIVFSTTLDSTVLQNRMNVSNLSGGVYVVTIENNGQQKTQKVIIK